MPQQSFPVSANRQCEERGHATDQLNGDDSSKFCRSFFLQQTWHMRHRMRTEFCRFTGRGAVWVVRTLLLFLLLSALEVFRQRRG